MMENLFLNLLNMSITAAWLALAVILVRLLLKKAPKWIMGLLWGFVGLRLICPFSIESIFSLLPTKETLPETILTDEIPQIQSGLPLVNSTVNPIIGDSLRPLPENSVNPMQVILYVAAVVWILGLCAMLLYALISYLRVRLQVREAVRKNGNVYLCDQVRSPFILGIVRPKIYLPSSLSDTDTAYVIAHERAHLRRLDVDGDGVTETLTLGIGPTSGPFTFTLNVIEEGVVEARNMYYSEWFLDFAFYEQNGQLYIRGGKNVTQKTENGGSETVYLIKDFTVSYMDGEIQIADRESGEVLKMLRLEIQGLDLVPDESKN